jgi:hypothetical protein
MPIYRKTDTIRPTQLEFGQLAYDVITAFTDRLEAFEIHSRCLLQDTTLKAIHWANITQKNAKFTTIR